MQITSKAYAFNDVIVDPGFARFDRGEADLSSSLCPGVPLKVPIVSSPMDTVTEGILAEAIYNLGGYGFLHRSLTTAEQAKIISRGVQNGCQIGAAIAPYPPFAEKVGPLVDAGLQVVLIDSAHGWWYRVIDTIKEIRVLYPEIKIIAGNVANAEGARALAEAGVHGLRNGMGPGAICTTREKGGVGVPQLTAIAECAEVAREFGICCIADGGIRSSSDVVKALAAGADSVMLGRLLAPTVESAAPKVWLKRDEIDRRFRYILVDDQEWYQFAVYRGMGSKSAVEEAKAKRHDSDHHGQQLAKSSVLITEGVRGLVPVTGSLERFVAEMIGGIQAGFFYAGCQSLAELHDRATFRLMSQNGVEESGAHDLWEIDDDFANMLMNDRKEQP